uniref:Centromere protein K n=1 Tax=Amphiprion ocellaris TaxID=80972 RepID=A0A3Q1DFB4_AMPOC
MFDIKCSIFNMFYFFYFTFLFLLHPVLAQNPEILFQAGKEEVCVKCNTEKYFLLKFQIKYRTTFIQSISLTCFLQMLKLCSELEMVVSCYEAKRDKLRESKELYHYNVHVYHSVLQDTKAKIQKMKVYQERLMESLGDILEKHVPLPQNESSASKKKKCFLQSFVLNTPHDPYVTIDDTFWPPYVEMLLRYGIAVRHQENNFKIRLETFF